MEQITDAVLAVLAAVGSGVAFAMGGWDTALVVLLCMMAVDYLTGLMVALVWHRSNKTESGAASSAAGFKGLLRKFVMLLVVFVGALMDKVLGIDYVRTAICMFYIANEGLSILENTAVMGVPWPAFVKNMLDVLKQKNDQPEKDSEPKPKDDEGGGEDEREDRWEDSDM